MGDVNMQDFPHVARGAELVTMGDRDVIAFIPEATMEDASSGMRIRGEPDGAVIWQTETPIVVAQGTRLLVWSRVVGGNLASGYRWVPSFSDENPDVANLRPLTNVFSPRITYDKSSNTLHMFFWTNFYIDYDGTDYDVSQLYDIGYEEESAGGVAKRVLCYAVGHFGRFYVEGGMISGFVENSSGSSEGSVNQDNKYDLVPYFHKPKILSNMVVSDNGPGIITDGGGSGSNSSGEGDAVLAVLDGSISTAGGITAKIYGEGFGHAATERTSVWAVDLAYDVSLTRSVAVIANKMAMDAVMVSSEDSSSSSEES